MNTWLLATLLCLMMFSSKYRINWNLLWRKMFQSTAKRIKKIPEGFRCSFIEMDKPIEYLRSTYPGKSDAEILAIRKKEMQMLLSKIVKLGLGKGSCSQHFTIKTFYPMDGSQTLVLRIEPKTEFGNKIVVQIMNHKIEENKGAWETEV